MYCHTDSYIRGCRKESPCHVRIWLYDKYFGVISRHWPEWSPAHLIAFVPWVLWLKLHRLAHMRHLAFYADKPYCTLTNKHLDQARMCVCGGGVAFPISLRLSPDFSRFCWIIRHDPFAMPRLEHLAWAHNDMCNRFFSMLLNSAQCTAVIVELRLYSRMISVVQADRFARQWMRGEAVHIPQTMLSVKLFTECS